MLKYIYKVDKYKKWVKPLYVNLIQGIFVVI